MASRRRQKEELRARRLAAQAEAENKARRSRGLRIGLWASGGATVVAIIALLVAANGSGGGKAAPVTPSDPAIGAKNAPVTVIEYGDFKCPNCASFFHSTEPQLRRNFVDRGKVRLVWRDFPVIDRESEPAAIAARCAAAQGRFWQYRDGLYGFIWDNAWGRGLNAEGRRVYTGHYDALARRAGVSDLAAFRQCRESAALQSKVTAARDAGVKQGVDGTPTFFINGQRLVGAQPYGVFRRLIQAQLG